MRLIPFLLSLDRIMEPLFAVTTLCVLDYCFLDLAYLLTLRATVVSHGVQIPPSCLITKSDHPALKKKKK